MLSTLLGILFHSNFTVQLSKVELTDSVNSPLWLAVNMPGPALEARPRVVATGLCSCLPPVGQASWQPSSIEFFCKYKQLGLNEADGLTAVRQGVTSDPANWSLLY